MIEKQTQKIRERNTKKTLKTVRTRGLLIRLLNTRWTKNATDRIIFDLYITNAETGRSAVPDQAIAALLQALGPNIPLKLWAGNNRSWGNIRNSTRLNVYEGIGIVLEGNRQTHCRQQKTSRTRCIHFDWLTSTQHHRVHDDIAWYDDVMKGENKAIFFLADGVL